MFPLAGGFRQQSELGNFMRLAIVGGGAAAVILVNLVVLRCSENVKEVTVHEPGPVVGPGRAYQRDLSCALLNTPTGAAGVGGNGGARRFAQWLDEQGASADPAGYQPRAVFGKYLQHCFLQAQRRAAERGTVVRVIHQSVQQVRPCSDQVVLTTSDGATFAHDLAVLSPGSAEPAAPFGLPAAENLLVDPYPLWRLLPAVPRTARVLVLGTGLSGVDVANALLRHGHTGGITLASRRGLLPGVRHPDPVHQPRHATAERFRELQARGRIRTITDVLRFAGSELVARGISPQVGEEFAHPDRGFTRLARQIGSATAGPPWREVLIATLQPIVEPAWAGLTGTQQLRFLAHYHHLFTTFMNPMPLSTAEVLLAAHRHGRLDLLAGIGTVDSDGEGYCARARGGTSVRADVVVNALPQPPGAAALPLLTGLLARGAAVAHPCGGVRIDPGTGRVLTAQGAPQQRLFALGALTRGTHLVTNSLRSLQRQADDIVDSIASASANPAHRPDARVGAAS